MKASAAELERLLRDPKFGFALFHGPDQGLIRERADALTARIVDDVRDPFRTMALSGAALKRDPARLADEAAALSFTGGRRVVRVEDADDGVARLLEPLIADAVSQQRENAAFVVVEARELRPRSELRRLFEGAKIAAAIGCYADDATTLEPMIAEILAHDGLSASDEAVAYLVENLGSDRQVSRREIEKLALFMGATGTVSLEDTEACVGDSAATSLDELAHAVSAGDHTGLEASLVRSHLAVSDAVHSLRAIAAHFLRLHRAVGLAEKGRSREQAMAALRPPVFFKFGARFRVAMERWPRARLAWALVELCEAELTCKTTGAPADLVCSRTLMRIAHAA